MYVYKVSVSELGDYNKSTARWSTQIALCSISMFILIVLYAYEE